MKVVSRVLSNIITLILVFSWISMSYGFIEPNIKYIALGIVASALGTIWSMKYISLKEINSKKQNRHKKVIGLFSSTFILLSLLQQIVFGWYVLLYYVLLISIVYIAKEAKIETPTTPNN